MSTIPADVRSVLGAFAPLFSNPVWCNAQLLAIGAVLCVGKRTVTAALRVMGLGQHKQFTNYHRVLNRAKWNPLDAAKILLGLLVHLLPAHLPLIIGVDETIERRSGRKIKVKGAYRDPVRSTHKKVVFCFGLKWICMMLIVALPWSKRCWALPFLTVLAPSEAGNKAAGKRHKTTVDWTCQMIRLVRRWIPNRMLVLVGDGSYAAVALALRCAGFSVPVTLISHLRLDANLYDYPVKGVAGKRGRKPQKGKKQRSLLERSKDRSTKWRPIEVLWYDGIKRRLEMFSGVSLWYRSGMAPVEIKWVVLRDPKGQIRTEAFFSTNIEVSEEKIIRWYILRWNIEVVFEELRARFGFETQRQWSELAIARTTPALFGLFSLVVLMAHEMTKSGSIPIQNWAWYQKSEATFSDVLAVVRGQIWRFRYLENSGNRDDAALFDKDFRNSLLDILCYAA